MPLRVDLNILNQKGTPAFYSDTFANRPAFGFAGRIFISTDTAAIYEDTGTSWTLISNVSSGAGTLEQVTTNGNTTTKGIVVTSGNVAIGTATAGAPLDIHSTGVNAQFNGTGTNNAYLQFQNAGASKWKIGNTYSAGANLFELYNNVTASVSLQIENSTNNAVFQSNVSATRYILKNATSPSGLYFGHTDRVILANYGTGGIDFETNGGIINMTLFPSGNLGIGVGLTDNGNKLQVDGVITSSQNLQIIKTVSNSVGAGPFTALVNTGNVYQIIQQLNASYNLDFWSYRGSFTNIARIDGATGVYTPLSDINKKKDFEQSQIGLNSILSLKPTLYRMKNEENTEKHLGFIAQEVKDYIPQAYVEKDNFIGLNEMPIIAALVKSIQELNNKLVRNNIN
jgi:hypothetical protein